jgi:hypothetical protein
LTETGRLVSAVTIWRFRGVLVYNSKDMLRAQEIAQEKILRKSQVNEEGEDEVALRLYEEDNLAYVKFKEGGSLLTKLDFDTIKDFVRFSCHVETKKGDTRPKRRRRCWRGLQG